MCSVGGTSIVLVESALMVLNRSAAWSRDTPKVLAGGSLAVGHD